MTGPDLADAASELCKLRGYNFQGELGKGAQKSAYLARDARGAFALKLAVVGRSPDRLARETAALQTCAHASIAKLLEAFPHTHLTTTLWVVREEYLSGGTLEERLKAGVLAPLEVRRIALALAQVLEHLQDRRLVHRDIKPANVLFREDGVVPVLTDFGVVRMLDQPTITRAFMAMGPGTPAYAAPEQLNNQKDLIDWRTDQFGLAVMLAECLTGAHPFAEAGWTTYDAVVAVAARQRLPDARVAELEALGFGCLVRGMEPWPVARFRKPSQFIEALDYPQE